MDLNQLREILDLVRTHELSEFEVEHEGLKLKIRRNAAGVPVATMPAVSAPAPSVAAPPAGGAAVHAAPTSASDAADRDVELAVVKSPIVGTFYRSPEPGAPPFVDVGAQVKKGQVLCIIEAMKLMNEIEADVAGEIVRRIASSGQPVEYGQALFAIRPR